MKMIRHGVGLVLLALLSGVSAARPTKVIARIPETGLDGKSVEAAQPMKDVEVTGFITKNGDIFELPESRNLGYIQAREEPELEPGISMCRFGTIVVYSDTDCNTFFKPSHNLAKPAKVVQKEDESNVEESEDKPPKKKKKKTKAGKRKSSKNKRNKKKKTKKRKNQVRRKALKQRGDKKRRRNNLKRKKNSQRKKNNKQNVKRKKIHSSEERSVLGPMQFTIFYDRE